MEVNATIFLQIGIFLCLLVWLSRSLFAPILRLFDERERRIDGARIEASEFNALADEKAATFELEFARARDHARHQLSALKHSMDKEHNELLDSVKALAKDKIAKAEAELVHQEASVREQLRANSAVIANEMVGALLRPHAKESV